MPQILHLKLDFADFTEFSSIFVKLIKCKILAIAKTAKIPAKIYKLTNKNSQTKSCNKKTTEYSKKLRCAPIYLANLFDSPAPIEIFSCLRILIIFKEIAQKDKENKIIAIAKIIINSLINNSHL